MAKSDLMVAGRTAKVADQELFGRRPVAVTLPVPSGVQVSVGSCEVEVTGRGATVVVKLPKGILVEKVGHDLCLTATDSRKGNPKALLTTVKKELMGAMKGVTVGHVVRLALKGIGYRAAKVKGLEGSADCLQLRLGYSHELKLEIPEGVRVTEEDGGTGLRMEGAHLPSITGYAARVRSLRPPEPYKLKGIFVGGETLKEKKGSKGSGAKSAKR